MKYILIIIGSVLLVACGAKKSDEHAGHQAPVAESAEAKKPLSPRKSAMVMVGSNHVHIDYGSPSKRGRVIFGGLVGYDQVWTTGAHKATTLSFDKSIMINGQSIPAGKYGFFTIPSEKVWIIIINKDWDMHLADAYTEAADIVRIVASPIKLETPVESLTFEVESSTDKTGWIYLSWDTVKIGFEFQNN